MKDTKNFLILTPEIDASLVNSLEPKGIKVVLGNGFDLFCGLETKYSHFFIHESDKYKEIKKWKESILDLNVYISQISSNWKDFGPKYEIKDLNAWDIYFALGIGEQDKNWCDIESEMLSTFEEQNISKNKFQWSYVYTIAHSHTKNLMYALNLEYVIAAYIINKNVDISSEEKFYMFLLNELKKFEKNFGNYVNEQYKEKNDDYSKKSSIVFSHIDHFYDLPVRSIESFNYTDNTTMKNIRPNKYLDKLKHINGDFKNPIFGIDSSKIDVKSPKVIFTKVSRRLINSATTFDKSIGHTFEDDFNTLIVFGHSLCEHDYNYFFPIFDYLEITNIMKNSVLIFLYNVYDENKREEIILSNIRRVTCLIDSYEKYAGKNKDNRLIDSLTAQGRIRLDELIDY